MFTLLLAAALVGPPAPSPRPGAPTPETSLAPAPRGIGWGWYAFAAGGQVADVWTTARFRAVGIRESNDRIRGLADHPLELGTIKVAGSVALIYGASAVSVRVERRGHRKLAWIARSVPITIGVWGLVAAVHNERELSRHHAGPNR